VRTKVLSPINSVAVRRATELLAIAVQDTALAVRVMVSQVGGALTGQVVKPAGKGVTETLPEPPAAGAVAEAAPRVTVPVAPGWLTVKGLPSRESVAERLETELLAWAVQVTVLPLLVAASHAVWPVTVHAV
jgi:hypothetical protein